MPMSTQMDFAGRYDAEGKVSKALSYVRQPYVIAAGVSMAFQAAASIFMPEIAPPTLA